MDHGRGGEARWRVRGAEWRPGGAQCRSPGSARRTTAARCSWTSPRTGWTTHLDPNGRTFLTVGRVHCYADANSTTGTAPDGDWRDLFADFVLGELVRERPVAEAVEAFTARRAQRGPADREAKLFKADHAPLHATP